jgi:hypothetical protein
MNIPETLQKIAATTQREVERAELQLTRVLQGASAPRSLPSSGQTD